MALADSLNTPKASAFLSGKGMPPTPKGYVGVQEIGPIKEELTEARTKAEKDVGMADINIEREKSSQTIRDLEGQQVLAQKTAEDIRALPEREKLKTKREEFTEMKFVPTKDTAQDIAGLFSLVNVIGMAMGGGGKQSAQQAMYAMNGMLEGYQKGRGDLYKKEKESFDKNFKAMQEAVKTLEKDYEEAVKMYQYDKDAADIARKLALAKSGSSLFKAMEDRVGFIATLNAIKETVSSVDKAAEVQNKLQEAEDKRKTAAQEKERDRQFKLEMTRISAQGTQNRRDEKALQALGPALREIASQYPDGTANNLVGASPKDKDRITGSWRAIQESEDVADYVARNPNAVGAMAVVKNILKIDAIKSIKNEDEKQAAVDKSAMVDAAIDKAVQQNKITSDDAQSAKILQKKLFSLALSDVQGSGQRGSVYLDRQFQNLYDQASRQSTLMEIVRERAMENDRNLKMYKLNVERNQYPQNFPLINTQSVDTYIQDRKPKSSVPSDVEKSLQGKPDGTGKKAPDGKIYRIYGGVVKESAE